MKNLIILSGAGISAESGISTFRDANGLWENHDIMEVASIEGWRRNNSLVLDFYNQRRRQLFDVSPNIAHKIIADLEKKYNVAIITQNVDDLHERAGSKNVIHLHGELRKARSEYDENYVIPWEKDITESDKCPKGYQLRPNIVWFGEQVPLMNYAAQVMEKADIVIIIGTSMQVYPAAGLIGFASNSAEVYYIDPNPSINFEMKSKNSLKIIQKPATKGMQEMLHML